MPNIIKITAENADELLNTGAYAASAVIRLQTSATETGAYADVSGTGSTPTISLVSGTRIYTGYDPNGTSSSWYRTRYENVGATRLSDWTAVFQVGDETAGQLCSVYDVRERVGIATTDTTADEDLIEFIRQVSADIEGYCGRWFYPRPLSGTTTYRVHTTYGRTLFLPKGIRSITTLGIATQDQPATAGTYTTQTSTTYYIDPPDMERDVNWPGTRIVFTTTGGQCFYDASYGAEIVGAFGFASVPPDVQSVALNSVVRHWKAKSTGQSEVIGTSEFGGRLLRFIAPEEREVLDRYRLPLVG